MEFFENKNCFLKKNQFFVWDPEKNRFFIKTFFFQKIPKFKTYSNVRGGGKLRSNFPTEGE
jgi:hypothetical protein